MSNILNASRKLLDGFRVAARGGSLWDANGGWLVSVGIGMDCIVVTARNGRQLPKHLVREYEGVKVQWMFVTQSIQLLSD